MTSTNSLNQVRNSPPPPTVAGAGADANGAPPPGAPSFVQLLEERASLASVTSAYSTTGAPLSSGSWAGFAQPPASSAPPGWEKVVELYRKHGLVPPSPPSDPKGLQLAAQLTNQPRDPHSPSMIRVFGQPRMAPRPAAVTDLTQLLSSAEASIWAGQGVPMLSNAQLNRLSRSDINAWRDATRATMAEYRASLGLPPEIEGEPEYSPVSSIAIERRIAQWAADGHPMDELPDIEELVRQGGIPGGTFYIAKKAGLVPAHMNGATWSDIGGDYAGDLSGNLLPMFQATETRPAMHQYVSQLPKTPFEQLEDEWHAKQLYRAPDANEQWMAWQAENTALVNDNLDLIAPGRGNGFKAVGADVFSNPAAFLKAAELFGIAEYPPDHFHNGQDMIRFNARTGEVWLDPSRNPEAARRAGIVQPMTVGFVENRAMDPDFAVRYDAAKEADQAYWQKFKDYYGGNMSLEEMTSFADFVLQLQNGAAQHYEVPEVGAATAPETEPTATYALYTSPVSRLIANGPDSLHDPAWVERPWVKGFFAQFTSQDFHRWENRDRAGTEPFVDHPILGRLPQSVAGKFENWIVRQQPNLDFQGDETGRLYFEQVRRSYGEYWREKAHDPAAKWNFVYDPSYDPSAAASALGAEVPGKQAITTSAAVARPAPANQVLASRHGGDSALAAPTSSGAAVKSTTPSPAASKAEAALTPIQMLAELEARLRAAMTAVEQSPVGLSAAVPTSGKADEPAPAADEASGNLASALLANLESRSLAFEGLSQAVKRYAQLDQFWRLQDES